MTDGIVVIQQKTEAQLKAESGQGACAMPDGTYGAEKGSPAVERVEALAQEIELRNAGFKTMGTGALALEILSRKNALEPLKSCPADAVGSNWQIEPKKPGGPGGPAV